MVMQVKIIKADKHQGIIILCCYLLLITISNRSAVFHFKYSEASKTDTLTMTDQDTTSLEYVRQEAVMYNY